MHTYTVTRWPNDSGTATQQATISKNVEAGNHREALELSGLKEPGALVSVNGLLELNIRYQVDSLGRVTKLAHYGSID